MGINNLTTIILLHLVLALISVNVCLAEDTEIFVGNGSSSGGVQPNVLFMLDTSSSMTNKDGGSTTRLDRMKDALDIIINQSNNVNMGLMRFHKEGGPVLYPVADINQSVEELGGSESDLIIQVSESADDAEEYVTSGTVVLTETVLEMTKFAVGASSNNLTILVTNGSDDAEEHQNGSMESLTSTDLELMVESDVQKIGIRFQNVEIPTGSTITSASMEFQLNEDNGSTNSLQIKILGHKVSDSTAFLNSSNSISDRITNNPTNASVLWTPPQVTSVGDTFETNDLSTIVQENIDQPGWVSDRPITFLLQLESAGNGGKRIVESKDGSKAPILKISYATGGVDDEQKIGLRFQEVMIPRGATITSAVLEFEASADESGATSLTIQGEDIDNSPNFTASTNNISGRTLTSASVSWNSVPLWTAGVRYQSPDLSSILQEQVDRSGWCGGQSLSFIVSGAPNSLRRAKSYDSSSTSAPILRVSYDPDSIPANTCINQVIQASISSGSNDVEESSSGSVSTTSSDLELVNDGNDQTIGLRFTNVGIPKDTTILSAELIFSNDTSEPQNGPIVLTIKGENADDSADFSAATVTSRTTTGAVSWSPTAWGSSSELNATTDIGSIVQTIVNRAGWEQGNAMTFIISGSGSGKRVANSFEGNASLATRLRVVVSGSVEIPAQTVRDKLLETVENLNYKSGTPILDVLYEAALYYRGEDVLYGLTRGFGAVIGDGSLGDGSSSGSEYTRVSNALSWNGGGTILRPSGCTEDNPNSTSCINEYISSTATYISPITESCQANYQILLSDGEGYGTNSVGIVNTLMTNTPTCSGHDGCAEALSGFMHTADQSNSLEEEQTVATYTIGFNLAATNPQFLQDIAAAGGGSFYTASTSAELADVFQSILSEVLSSTSSFSAPTVSVNAFNKLFHDDDIYFSTFLPDITGRWAGNLKKYTICESGEVTCTSGDILDINGDSATSANGQFLDTSTSYWSASVDGQEVQAGGAGSNISYPRKIYIENSTSFAQLTAFDQLTVAKGTVGNGAYDTSLRALLDGGSLTDSGYLDLVKWILGQDINDEDEDNDTTDVRWAFADALHSQPLVVTYGQEGSNPIKKIFIGTNDGLLRMVNAENGIEEWALMPTSMTSEQNQLMVNASGGHFSGVDGNIRSLIIYNNENGIIEPANGDKVYLYFGMRRGGRFVYAIDVTPSSTLTSAASTTGITPAPLWKIQGGTTTYFEELGETWSTPQVDQIWYNNAKKTVVFFAGGYHSEQDDSYGPSSYGNGIYIVDALSGALLWRAGLTGALDGDNGVEFADMRFPIPSDLALLDTTADGAINRLYVGDTGGQVWRMDFKNQSGGMVGTGARLADISGRDASDNVAAEDQRKFFYPPDAALVNDFNFSSTTAFDLLIIVSGDRASPNDKTVHDRIYMFRDYVTTGTIADEAALPDPDPGDPDLRRFVDSLTESDLYDATENLIQDSDGTSTSADSLTEVSLLQAKDGWFVSLVEGTTDYIGEKGLSEPIIANDTAFLTTYVPSGDLVVGEVCAPPIEGTGRIYGLNILNATAVFSVWDGDASTYSRADRVYSQTLTGISSSPVLRMTPEGPQVLIGGGGGILQFDPDIDLPIVRSYWKEL